MKVSLNIYGENAKTLAKELKTLGLICLNKTAEVDMAAHFVVRDVEGHTVISASFTSKEAI